MSNIPKVNLTDTFNFQRTVVNQLVDEVNSNPKPTAGNGISIDSTNTVSVKTSGDGLSFDSSGNLIGNDSYPNLLTQVIFDPNTSAPAPSIVTETYIIFPEFDVLFDKKVYYGKKVVDFTTIHVDQTTMTVQIGADGAVYVYVNDSGQILQTMDHLAPADSSEQCLLGSYFRLSNKIQANSWKYTPWNGSTAKGARFLNPGAISGGLLSVATASTLSRAEVSIIYEGVNADQSVYSPNQISYQSESPYVTKKLWPGYDASVLDTSTLDTTHIYNMTNSTVDDISSLDGYIILIPGIVAPTGQDVYLMAMSNYTSSTYDQIYSTITEAQNALYGISLEFGNVASRVAWLGQSIIVKIGATDFTNPNEFRIVGDVPNVIRSYAALAGAGESSRVSGITIKDDSEVIGLPQTKTSINFGAGLGVENTSETGVRVDLNCMTNCITEIPQDIKLELNNGTLTLKAGSKVYVPNGFAQDGTTRVFNEVVVSHDITLQTSGTGGGQYDVYLSPSGEWMLYEYFLRSNSCSGAHTAQAWSCWYDTSTNLIYRYEADGNTPTTTISFPIARIELKSGSIVAVTDIWNGFGYIGSIIYGLPGVKYLIPNGRNNNGTASNINMTTESVRILDVSSRGSDFLFLDSSQNMWGWDQGSYSEYNYSAPRSNYWFLVYDTNRNLHFKSDNGAAYVGSHTCKIGSYGVGNSGVDEVVIKRVISFNIGTSFTPVIKNDLSALLSAIYSVGSIYIGTQSVCPLIFLIPGSKWEYIRGRYLLASGTLDGTSETYYATNTVASGAPNITGEFRANAYNQHYSGAFSNGNSNVNEPAQANWIGTGRLFNFNAANSNSIYGQSGAIRSPAYVVNVWRRTA